MNECRFSPDRIYRYTLLHRWDELAMERQRVMWCGLNPSIADEQQLDPTLRRVRGFSTAWGFNEFVMTNLFAYRATSPRDMLLHHAPIGPENDDAIRESSTHCAMVIACWGNHGNHLARDVTVMKLLDGIGMRVFCLARNHDGSPAHPLYLKRDLKPVRFTL